MHKVEQVTQQLWGYTFFPISSRQKTLSFTLGTRNCWQRVPNTRGRHEFRIWPRSLKAMNFSLLCYFFDEISSRKWCISSVFRLKAKDIRLTLTIFSFVTGNCLLTQRNKVHGYNTGILREDILTLDRNHRLQLFSWITLGRAVT